MIAITDAGAVAVLYALANGAAFFAYAHDKRKAAMHRWRTPEKTLFMLAVIGPFGAYAAMNVFRHKTQKKAFKLVPACLVVHLAAILWFLYAAVPGTG